MNITPDQASNLLDGATPGPWGRTQMGALTDTDGKVLVHGPDGNMDDGDATLAAAAPDMAQTIAGCEEQWAAQWHANDARGWMFCEALPVAVDRLTAPIWVTEDIARARLAYLSQYEPCTRLVRRLVSETEVVES